jgi:hypothetical protein
MEPSGPTAYVYVDGWNFYHGINKPGLHPLGFCNFWKLGQYMLGGSAKVTKVRYFSAVDYHPQVAAAQQKFWLRALKSVKVEVAELGRFEHFPQKQKVEEKTTDVRLALQLDEDARTAAHKWVLLISADADFVPALQRAKRLGKMVKVAFPPGLRCNALKEVDPFPFEINKEDLELNLIDGEGTTEQPGERLTKALEYGWACRLKGQVVYGDQNAEKAHWVRWRPRQ